MEVKKLYCSVFFLCLLIVSAQAQKNIPTGALTRKAIERYSWFEEAYKTYTPDLPTITKLKTALQEQKQLRLLVILGTWCSDSQQEVPRLLKVLDQCEAPKRFIKMYAVNKRKTRPACIIAAYRVQRVPTVICLDTKHKEKGRVVEHPAQSWEKDLLLLFQEMH